MLYPAVAEGFRANYLEMEPEREERSSSTAFSKVHAGSALRKSEFQVAPPLVPAAGRCSRVTGDPSATIQLMKQHIQHVQDGFSEQDRTQPPEERGQESATAWISILPLSFPWCRMCDVCGQEAFLTCPDCTDGK